MLIEFALKIMKALETYFDIYIRCTKGRNC